MDLDQKWLVDFNAGKLQLVSFDLSNNNCSTDVKMNGSVLAKKSFFKMLHLTFSSKLDWVSYIISITKTTSKKSGALIRSMKFLSPEVALYLYKSTIRPCMGYWCHIWAGATGTPSCYLELLEKQQKQYVGLLVLHLLPLWKPWLIVKMWPAKVFSIGIALMDVLQNWLNCLHFFCRGRSARYSDRLHYFSVNIPRYYKNVYVKSFFAHTVRLWNSLPIECFPLIYDLSGFKARISRHLLTVGSFQTDFLYAAVFLCFFFL